MTELNPHRVAAIALGSLALAAAPTTRSESASPLAPAAVVKGAATTEPQGGWTFAHWGMTRRQLRAAAAAAGVRVADAPDDPGDILESGVTLAEIKMNARFRYDAPGDKAQLDEIDLEPAAGQAASVKLCAAMTAYETKLHGKPDSVSTTGDWRGPTWHVVADGDQIGVGGIPGYDCFIELNPLPPG